MSRRGRDLLPSPRALLAGAPSRPWLVWVGLGVLALVLGVGLPVLRCHLARHADGTATASWIEGDVLLLEDRVCVGRNNGIADCDQRTIRVRLPDGRRLGTGLDDRLIGTTHGERCDLAQRIELAGQPYRFAGAPAYLAPADAEALGESPTGRAPLTFTAPSFAGAVDDEALVVDAAAGYTRLARLRRDGGARWVVVLPGACHLVRRFGDLLVVATTAASHRAVAVDVTTGALRWRITP